MLSECFKTISECFLNAFKLMAFGIQDLKKDLQNTPHSSQHAQCFGKILKRENRKKIESKREHARIGLAVAILSRAPSPIEQSSD